MAEDLSKLTLVDLIDLLEPPPDPAPISMLPQTVGWIWVGLALIGILGFAIHRWRVRRAANAYRVAALAELKSAASDPVAIADILRRTALMAFPRTDVAGLHGDDWLAFLDRTGGGSAFREGQGRALATAPYRPGEAPAGLAGLAAGWIRGHKGPRA